MKPKKIPALTAIMLAIFIFSGCPAQRHRGGVQLNSENLTPVGTLPVVYKTESFTLLVDDFGDPDTKLMMPIFEAATNVRVDVAAFPWAAAVERMNILLATGQYPDAIGGWLMNPELVVRLASDGILIPLQDFIDEHTVYIRYKLNMPGVRKAMTHPSGNIYTVPYLVEEPEVLFLPWINTAWLERVGLPMPTTTEEFRIVLRAFRDNIPPIGGQAIIPFSWQPHQIGSLGALAGWFGLNANGLFAMIDGRLEITITRHEYRNFLRFFSKLFAEGLIDPELFTQNQQTWMARGRQGLFGASFAYGPDDFAPRISDDPSANMWEFEALPVLRAPGVERPVFIRGTPGFTLFRSQFGITSRATNPITILRWLDHIFGEQQSLETRLGPIGYRFEQLEDGTFRGIDTSGWSPEELERFNNSWFWSMPIFLRIGERVAPPAGMPPEYMIKDTADNLYRPYLDEMIPTFWMDPATGRRVAALQHPIDLFHVMRRAEWITGQRNIDADWDTFVAEMERLGIQELLQIMRGLVGCCD